MRRSIFACGLLLVLAGIPSVASTAAGGILREATVSVTQSGASTQATAQSVAFWVAKAHSAQAATKYWLTVVRGRPPRLSVATPKDLTPAAAETFARNWHVRAVAASRHAHHPPELHAWYCIHHYEGSWTDPNAPYWGGLQMDYSFQSAYGAWLLKHKGTANHWAPLAQIWAGVRAWRVRGFEPWANTAHACGVY